MRGVSLALVASFYVLFTCKCEESSSNQIHYKVFEKGENWKTANKQCTDEGLALLSVLTKKIRTQLLSKELTKIWTAIKLQNSSHLTAEDGSVYGQTEKSGAFCETIHKQQNVKEVLSCWAKSVRALCVSKACFSCVNATCRMFRGICYTWSEMSMSWYQARTWCRDRDAQIPHPRFLPAVRQFLGVQNGPRGRFYWIGLKKAHWYMDGKIVSNMSWATGHPTDGMECVKLHTEDKEDLYYSESCTAKLQFVCAGEKLKQQTGASTSESFPVTFTKPVSMYTSERMTQAVTLTDDRTQGQSVSSTWDTSILLMAGIISLVFIVCILISVMFCFKITRFYSKGNVNEEKGNALESVTRESVRTPVAPDIHDLDIPTMPAPLSPLLQDLNEDYEPINDSNLQDTKNKLMIDRIMTMVHQSITAKTPRPSTEEYLEPSDAPLDLRIKGGSVKKHL